ILPPPKEEAPRAAGRRIAAAPVPQLQLERLATLTGLPLPKEPEVQEPDQPALDPNAPPVKSGLRVKLLGTLAAEISRLSIATILDLGTQRAQTYSGGDTIRGADTLQTLGAAATVLKNNRREYISNEDGAVASYTPPEPRRIGPGEPNPSGIGAGIKSTGDNEYEVPRPEIDK